MKLWKDMTPEEKGALLLASHEGKVIEWCYGFCEPLTFHVNGSSDKGGMEPCWDPKCYYRVKPEPVVKEVVMYAGAVERLHVRHLISYSWVADEYDTPTITDTHKITFNLVDGEPDCNSIKMFKL